MTSDVLCKMPGLRIRHFLYIWSVTPRLSSYNNKNAFRIPYTKTISVYGILKRRHRYTVYGNSALRIPYTEKEKTAISVKATENERERHQYISYTVYENYNFTRIRYTKIKTLNKNVLKSFFEQPEQLWRLLDAKQQRVTCLNKKLQPAGFD